MATGGSGWDCPFCTYINKQSSFKCDMCKASRGTSTRQARMQPHVLVLHQSTETPKTAKTSTTTTTTATAATTSVASSSSLLISHSTSGQSSSSTEKDRVSSASSSRSSSPMSQLLQTGSQPPLKVLLTKSATKAMSSSRKGKSRSRSSKSQNWPRIPGLDYRSGISLNVECRKVTATITEYTLQQP